MVEEKLEEWSNKQVKSEDRWLEIFKALAQQNRHIHNLSLLVQYAFAIPGSSTEVERLFSIINDVWGPDKPQMKIETLEAFLNIKVNSNLNMCRILRFNKGQQTTAFSSPTLAKVQNWQSKFLARVTTRRTGRRRVTTRKCFWFLSIKKYYKDELSTENYLFLRFIPFLFVKLWILEHRKLLFSPVFEIFKISCFLLLFKNLSPVFSTKVPW